MLASVFLIDEGVEPDKFFNVRQRMRPCPEHLKPGMIRQRAFKGRDLTFLEATYFLKVIYRLKFIETCVYVVIHRSELKRRSRPWNRSVSAILLP
jgi:hypothetical protein